MSRKHKNNFYQTEYSLSFNWKTEDQINNSKHLKNDIIDRSSKSPVLIDRRMHQFRHKLKCTLLEKLEKLESELDLNNSSNFDEIFNCSTTNHQKHSHRKNFPLSPAKISELSKTNSLNKRSKSKTKNVNRFDQVDWKNELRRSRSMAMEFKHKNESTQIWWLTESIDISSSEESFHDQTKQSSIPRERLNSRMSVSQKSPPKDNSNCQMAIKRNSIFSHRPLMELSQSSLSKSSFSCQIAQATGYQSTTDDLSSFNHDTDTKSIDRFVTNKRMSISEALKDDSCKFGFNHLPKLKLQENDYPNNDFSSRNNTLVFYGPYQTEDFNKDTSSDSNLNNSMNFDTYRLD